MERYDVVIIGSGLGGLACASMLGREGMSVCVLEQQKVPGGCLQSFTRHGYTMDTGMHYIGSLSEGQVLNQYFKYFGVLDKIRLKLLDADAFDVINLSGKEYAHAMGYDRFIDTLSREFPAERKDIAEYCRIVRKIGGLISVDILRQGKLSMEGLEYMAVSAFDTLRGVTGNRLLQNVLAGSIPLYGYDRDKSSLYEHCMIHHSNIEGASRFVGPSQHVADAFVKAIRDCGGVVRTASEVTGLHVGSDGIDYVEVNGEERISAGRVISAIHPANTLSLLTDNKIIRKAFFTRIQSLENSFGLFSTYLLMKPGAFRYFNKNYYFYNTPDVWSREAMYKDVNMPVVMMSSQVPEGDCRYSSVITLLTPISYRHLARWENTRTGERGAEYEGFKEDFARKMYECACRFFPGLSAGVQYIHAATPLTFRDYNSMPYGSAYGIVKDYHHPSAGHLSPKTKIRNLFLTGQNLNVHGCLGVSVSAAVTCGEILGTEYLARKIGHI